MNIKQQIKKAFSFGQDVVEAFQNDNAFTLAAAISYYTIFSIAPLLVIILAVSSFFLGAEAVRGELYLQLSGLLGSATADHLEEIIKNVYVSGKTSLATIISIGALLISATAVVGQLQNALNAAFSVKHVPNNAIVGILKTRLLSLAFILGLGFIFLVSLGLNSIALYLSNQLISLFPVINSVVTVAVPVIISLLITMTIFALLFKFLPNVILQWEDVWVGALFTALLFAIGKYLIGIYIGNSSITSTFGSAGALASLLLWVYYSSLILILGAEFTKVWALRSEHPIPADSQSVKVRVKEVLDNR